MAWPPLPSSGPIVFAEPVPPHVHAERNHAGTHSDPFQFVQQAIEAVNGGGRVLLKSGTFYEQVNLDTVKGKLRNKIVVQPVSGPVTIDCLETGFLDLFGGSWVYVNGNPSGVDEYFWSGPLDAGQANRVSRGAFLGWPSTHG